MSSDEMEQEREMRVDEGEKGCGLDKRKTGNQSEYGKHSGSDYSRYVRDNEKPGDDRDGGG